jgi:hypothetical protein
MNFNFEEKLKALKRWDIWEKCQIYLPDHILKSVIKVFYDTVTSGANVHDRQTKKITTKNLMEFFLIGKHLTKMYFHKNVLPIGERVPRFHKY